MRIGIVALAMAGAAAMFTTPAGAQEAAAVKIVDNDYQDKTITVAVGTTVTWTHDGNRPHSVSADNGSFDSSPNCPGTCMARGQSFTQTFSRAGTFGYFCRIHGGPNGDGMSGVVVVQDAQAPAPTAQPTEQPAPTARPAQPPAYTQPPAPQAPVPEPAYRSEYQQQPRRAAQPRPAVRPAAPTPAPATPAPEQVAATTTFEPVPQEPATSAPVAQAAAAPAASKGKTSPTRAFVFGMVLGLIAGAFITGAAKFARSA